MNEPIVPVDAIALDARTAVETRLPATACPYPIESAAGMRWLIEYHAHPCRAGCVGTGHLDFPQQQQIGPSTGARHAATN